MSNAPGGGAMIPGVVTVCGAVVNAEGVLTAPAIPKGVAGEVASVVNLALHLGHVLYFTEQSLPH